MTAYKTVYDRFKLKIEDAKLAQMDDNVQGEFLLAYLESALAYIEVGGLRLKNDVFDRDNTLLQFNTSLTTSEIEVVALYMVVAWYDSLINSLEHTLMFYGSKDERWTSQKEHLKSLIDAQEMYLKRARAYFRDYSYKHNSYLGTAQR